MADNLRRYRYRSAWCRDFQDREIRVDEIADIEIAAVGAKGAASGNAPTLISPALVTFLPSILSAVTVPVG